MNEHFDFIIIIVCIRKGEHQGNTDRINTRKEDSVQGEEVKVRGSYIEDVVQVANVANSESKNLNFGEFLIGW
jgi:hypothetical protein